MPGRTEILATDEIYHVYNRGVASQPIFFTNKNYQRAVSTIFYYCNQNLPLRYSDFIVQSHDKKIEILEKLKNEKKFLVEIIAFCLMPNHFHFLLKQVIDNGISNFLSKFTNSYTRYVNSKNKRSGSLLQGRFKAVRIENDEQFLHVGRYIHLNPYSSYIVKKLPDLENYPYSSLPEYLRKTKANFCHKRLILNQFKDKTAYKKFVFDQANYQRELQNIKHLILES
ncbi:MAG TPA: transposase [Candidatus Bathyarchaeia archaeon]|nr:transposase [Candidatus Bathyarchaeia archaeon]